MRKSEQLEREQKYELIELMPGVSVGTQVHRYADCLRCGETQLHMYECFAVLPRVWGYVCLACHPRWKS